MTEQKSISKECKLFKDCPFNWDCLYEIAVTGSALWSLDLCYDLKRLIDCGYVERKDRNEMAIAYFMVTTFKEAEK